MLVCGGGPGNRGNPLWIHQEPHFAGLQQLDSLVAQHALHTQYDVTNAAQQRDDVAAAMATLADDTKVAWANSTDPSIGWCNINNADIPRLWAERWKK